MCFWQKCGRHSKGRCTSTTCRQVAVLGMTLGSRETARQSWVQRCWDRCLRAGRWGTLPAAVATMLTTTTEQHSLLILVSPQQSSPTLLSQYISLYKIFKIWMYVLKAIASTSKWLSKGLILRTWFLFDSKLAYYFVEQLKFMFVFTLIFAVFVWSKPALFQPGPRWKKMFQSVSLDKPIP